MVGTEVCVCVGGLKRGALWGFIICIGFRVCVYVLAYDSFSDYVCEYPLMSLQ